jgi:hypothetical protein
MTDEQLREIARAVAAEWRMGGLDGLYEDFAVAVAARATAEDSECAEAWRAVWDKLRKHNRDFFQQARTGQQAALQEIDRLYMSSGEAGAVGKSETPTGGVGNQMPGPGSSPGTAR